MVTIEPFDWRRLTTESRLEYKLNEGGVLLLRGGDEPPLATANVRDMKGGFSSRAFDALPFTWVRADEDGAWALRTRGEPSTMARVTALWGDVVRNACDPLGIDERLVLATIACEAGAAAPDDDGHVKAPRTERGYPRRRGEGDPGDPERDAEDWAIYQADPRHRIAHSSHGLMQTLISTAVAARPDLFEGIEPSRYRTVLWDPASSIACGAAHMASFPADTLRDPLRLRFQYGGGHVAPTSANPWGAGPLYDDLVPLFFLAFWNDDACIRAGACDAPRTVVRPESATAAWVFAAASCFALSLLAAFGAAHFRSTGVLS